MVTTTAGQLQPGDSFNHYGVQRTVQAIEDASAFLYLQRVQEGRKVLVTCMDGYQLTMPVINNIEVARAAA